MVSLSGQAQGSADKIAPIERVADAVQEGTNIAPMTEQQSGLLDKVDRRL